MYEQLGIYIIFRNIYYRFSKTPNNPISVHIKLVVFMAFRKLDVSYQHQNTTAIVIISMNKLQSTCDSKDCLSSWDAAVFWLHYNMVTRFDISSDVIIHVF